MSTKEAVSPTIVGLQWDGPGAGGASRYIRDLHRHVWPESDVVVMVSSEQDPSHVRAMGTGALARIRTQLANAGVVNAHAPYPVSLWAADPTTRSTPLLFHFHGPWAEESAYERSDGDTRYRLRRLVERIVARRATRTVTLSRAFASKLMRDHGVKADAVEVIPPMVDLERFSPGSQADARARLGLESGRQVIVCARRLVQRTGVEDLVVAASLLEPKPKLVIVGDGPRRESLETLAQGRGLDAWFTGHISESGLVDAYRAANLSVVPSTALEGFGLATLESLACGTPAIVTDTGGAPEAVNGLDPTLVVAPRDPHGLAARLRAALDGDLPGSEDCVSHAQKFNVDAFREAHLAVLDKIR